MMMAISKQWRGLAGLGAALLLVACGSDGSGASASGGDCAGANRVTDVTMNDSDEGNGAGTFPDWLFDPTATVEAPGTLDLELRAERSEGSNSVDDTRIYTVTVECENGAGASATSSVEVTVVSDQGGGG